MGLATGIKTSPLVLASPMFLRGAQSRRMTTDVLDLAALDRPLPPNRALLSRSRSLDVEKYPRRYG